MSEKLPARIQTSAQVLKPQTFGELMQFAQMASKSALVPRDYQGKPENVMLAVQMGSEIGLAPMQALQNIAVINGRPAVWGDAMIALARASHECQDIVEKIEGEGDQMTAICIAKRINSEPVIAKFSIEDAKKAGLWNKSGPWTQYPKRMLQMRARSFALRDAFPDVLKGLGSAEEEQDIITATTPIETYAGTTIDADTLPEARWEIVTSQGVRKYETLDDLKNAWVRAVKNYVAANAFEKLSAMRDLNESSLSEVSEVDPTIYLIIVNTIAEALGEPPTGNPVTSPD